MPHVPHKCLENKKNEMPTEKLAIIIIISINLIFVSIVITIVSIIIILS